jgi:hypothetical protein
MRLGGHYVVLTDSSQRYKSHERHPRFVQRVRSQRQELEGLNAGSRRQAALHVAIHTIK